MLREEEKDYMKSEMEDINMMTSKELLIKLSKTKDSTMRKKIVRNILELQYEYFIMQNNSMKYKSIYIPIEKNNMLTVERVQAMYIHYSFILKTAKGYMALTNGKCKLIGKYNSFKECVREVKMYA